MGKDRGHAPLAVTMSTSTSTSSSLPNFPIAPVKLSVSDLAAPTVPSPSILI
eukprot:CAMPEP_0119480002 /NCGR_PEP_ID=MMETSP1344-20130328/9014_1 /TAXON_ID=236787 /ORGANISM="Florenciella parvula, Strain CCMP2471" /LENGTH=51 /DNA_ID=CAMNT_0007514281 /DNA_START=284 /DNA_END=439 /DNA_ORIENTATION=-